MPSHLKIREGIDVGSLVATVTGPRSGSAALVRGMASSMIKKAESGGSLRQGGAPVGRTETSLSDHNYFQQRKYGRGGNLAKSHSMDFDAGSGRGARAQISNDAWYAIGVYTGTRGSNITPNGDHPMTWETSKGAQASWKVGGQARKPWLCYGYNATSNLMQYKQFLVKGKRLTCEL